jgi:predicted nucleotidyltransferase
MSQETLKFGLSHNNFVLLKSILKPLQASSKLFLFGSRARGDFKKYSDIDLLIVGDVSQQMLSEVKEALEESSLPYKVDLVLEKDLAPSYQENIRRDMIPF